MPGRTPKTIENIDALDAVSGRKILINYSESRHFNRKFVRDLSEIVHIAGHRDRPLWVNTSHCSSDPARGSIRPQAAIGNFRNRRTDRRDPQHLCLKIERPASSRQAEVIAWGSSSN